MSVGDDELVFAPEAPAGAPESTSDGGWKVMVVDDEPDVEAVTRQALRWVRFDGAPIEVVGARSAEEAKRLVEQHPDTAVMLLDVVMETPSAGLDFVRWLRGSGRLPHTRVLLRTGQPGNAPETSVMTDYDLHDYLDKSELMVTRLRTSVLGGLRAYRDLRALDEHRRGLAEVLTATAELFRPRSTEALTSAILGSIGARLAPNPDLLFFRGRLSAEEAPPTIVAATGAFTGLVGKTVEQALGAGAWERLTRELTPGTLSPCGEHLGYAFRNSLDGTAAVLIGGRRELETLPRSLIELFGTHASMALDNEALWRRQARTLDAVTRFVPQPLLDTIGIRQVEEVRLGDHVSTHMAVLFCDIVGFTRLSGRLSSGELFQLVNQVFGLLTPVVESQGGVVDKFLGDGLLALFPTGEAAVRAAVGMLGALDAANAERRLPFPVELGVGIHEGAVVLGTVGYERRMDTTVISEAVNVAARVEQLTRTYGARILISEAVRDGLGDELTAATRRLGSVQVRGRDGLVRIAEVIAADPPARRAARGRGKERLEHAVALAERGAITEAIAALRELASAEPDDPTPARLANQLSGEAATR